MKQAKKDIKKKEEKSDSKKRTGANIYIGKLEHVFNKKWETNEIKALADELMEWFNTADENGKNKIWLRDFCISKGINRQRLSEFEKNDEYFKYIYSLCNMKQESILFKLGLTVKSSMPIFALKNIAGWKDQSEVITHEGVTLIHDDIV
jgi:hypothetical protein